MIHSARPSAAGGALHHAIVVVESHDLRVGRGVRRRVQGCLLPWARRKQRIRGTLWGGRVAARVARVERESIAGSAIATVP